MVLNLFYYSGAQEETWTPTMLLTCPSNMRVYRFRHLRSSKKHYKLLDAICKEKSTPESTGVLFQILVFT